MHPRHWPIRRVVQTLGLALFLALLLFSAWPYAEPIGPTSFLRREFLPLEIALWLDPLVGVAAAIAAREWSIALVGAGVVLAVCAVLPRFFCGYCCPLGTLHDLFTWLVGRHLSRSRITHAGAWRYGRFYLLGAVIIGALGGVMLVGYTAALPVVTRGLVFSVGFFQVGLLKNWGLLGPMTAGIWCSLALFLAIILLNLVTPRFWCRYLCPTGALVSLPALLQWHRRAVKPICTHCGHCLTVCPFDAIQADISTRGLDCAFCRTCLEACPSHALHFASRSNLPHGLAPGSPRWSPPLSRRAAVTTLAAGAMSAWGLRAIGRPGEPLLRPPGSVAEDHFLERCVRCGECFKVCPGSALQPAGWEHGLDALWTPVLTPTQAGCHPDCNFCTQVCPTRAIRPLTLELKRQTKVGLAVIDSRVCLPHRGERDCRYCFEECEAAGYRAIQMRPIQLPIGEVPGGVISPDELEQMSRIDAPFVVADACVGCGLCEYRCHALVRGQQGLIPRSAIQIVAPDERRKRR